MRESNMFISVYMIKYEREKNHTITEELFFLHEVKMRTNTVYYDHHAVWKFFLRSCEKNFKNVGVNFCTSGIPESFMDFCQTIV